MSTYYYLGCDEHKQRTRVIAVERMFIPYANNTKELIPFMLNHENCSLRFFSEYDEDREAYKTEDEV